jgi:hypothetical protein
LRGSAYCGLFISRYSENDILPVTRAAATSSDQSSHFFQGSSASRKQADSLLTRLETFVAGTHGIRFLIEVFALQALLHDAQGGEPDRHKAVFKAKGLAIIRSH